jgi:hypothetical protein
MTSRRVAHTKSLRPLAHRPHRNLHSSADIFVGTSFRYWLTGFRTGDLAHWERAFEMAQHSLGPLAAREVCRDFSQWVRILSERSHRELEVLKKDSPCFCRDECVAMALVAAHQHKACPALQACAMTLLDCQPRSDLDALSGSLAERLSAADHVLSKYAMDHVVRYASGQTNFVL